MLSCGHPENMHMLALGVEGHVDVYGLDVRCPRALRGVELTTADPSSLAYFCLGDDGQTLRETFPALFSLRPDE